MGLIMLHVISLKYLQSDRIAFIKRAPTGHRKMQTKIVKPVNISADIIQWTF
jgi:hypothetical protein